MGMVTIQFLGICTHIRACAVTGVRHRVVVVNAQQTENVENSTIGRHTPLVNIPAMNVEWRGGGGYSFEIANGIGAGPIYDPSFEACVPHLTQYAPAPWALSAGVTDPTPAFAAYCFDVPTGRFTGGKTPKGAAVSTVMVETADPPMLKVKQFGEVGSMNLPLSGDVKIIVSNLGASADDDDVYDFLIHYRLFEMLPTNACVPGPPCPACPVAAIEPGWPGNAGNVDAGCSCSQYP